MQSVTWRAGVAPGLLLLIGVWAGLAVAYEGSKSSGLPGLAYFWMVPIGLVALTLVALGLRERPRSGSGPSSMGTQAVLCGVGLALGAFAGVVVARPLGATYSPPVTLSATGPATLTLIGATDFEPAAGTTASCVTTQGDESHVTASATNAGSLRAVRLYVELGYDTRAGGSVPMVIELRGESGDNARWQGQATVTVSDGGSASGTATFDGLTGTNPDDKGAPGSTPMSIGDWPATLSGSLTWACGRWEIQSG